MHFINFSIFVAIICPSIISVHASESCSYLTTCSNYCCKSSYSVNYCCSDCSQSINNHPECYYSTISIPSIIGGVISSIIFIIVVSLLISICCGCICSSRTGIQRRGHIIRAQPSTVTVINSNTMPQSQFVNPPYAVVYPPGQAQYPQGQLPYPPAYTENQNPPPYNLGFVPKHP